MTGSAANNAPLTWVVGAGGLLGRQVAARAQRLFQAPTVPWSDHQAALTTLRDAAERFVAQAAELGCGWQVLWCAGAGVTSTTEAALSEELECLQTTLDALRPATGGAFFLASSVGAVYAGNPHPPFTETSATAALAPYGRAKLTAEEAVRTWSEHSGNPSLLGRISNLYGPGQNLAKPQGLISQICANHVRRIPSSIWVSLDTIRDYIYVDDCAELIHDAVARLEPRSGCVTKILASGNPMSISAVIGEIKRVLGRKPDLLLGGSPNAKFQVRDLSVESQVWPDLNQRALTPFGVGVARTIADVEQRMAG